MAPTHCLLVTTLAALFVSSGCEERLSSSDASASAPDASAPAPDASIPPVRVLTLAERAAVAAQVVFELEQMNLLTGTASAEASQHTLVVRPPFPWVYFTNDMTCLVDADFPEGCRSGNARFDPNFTFERFDPAVEYAYVWAGPVGSLTGTASFDLMGTPTSWRDGRPAEPNDDALIAIRAHRETVTVTESGGSYVFVREATKDFDITRAGETIRLRHTDTTTSTIEVQISGTRDVRALVIEARFTDLEVTARVAIDSQGRATGDVRSGEQVLAVVSGEPFAPEARPLEFAWDR